jgi:hypothetical protein
MIRVQKSSKLFVRRGESIGLTAMLGPSDGAIPPGRHPAGEAQSRVARDIFAESSEPLIDYDMGYNYIMRST